MTTIRTTWAARRQAEDAAVTARGMAVLLNRCNRLASAIPTTDAAELRTAMATGDGAAIRGVLGRLLVSGVTTGRPS